MQNNSFIFGTYSESPTRRKLRKFSFTPYNASTVLTSSSPFLNYCNLYNLNYGWFLLYSTDLSAYANLLSLVQSYLTTRSYPISTHKYFTPAV